VNADERERLRIAHLAYDPPSGDEDCGECEVPYPCPTTRLLDELEQVERERDEAIARVARDQTQGTPGTQFDPQAEVEARLAEIRADDHYRENGNVCGSCMEPWPCNSAFLLERLDLTIEERNAWRVNAEKALAQRDEAESVHPRAKELRTLRQENEKLRTLVVKGTSARVEQSRQENERLRAALEEIVALPAAVTVTSGEGTVWSPIGEARGIAQAALDQPQETP